MNPNEATKEMRPSDLANQLFDAAILQYRNDPREAARQVINFLMEALVYTISSTAGDENARKALLKSVAEKIASTAESPAATPPGAPAKP